MKDKELKTETVSIRLTPKEKEYLQELADVADMSVSKYLHRTIFQKGGIEYEDGSKPKDNNN